MKSGEQEIFEASIVIGSRPSVMERLFGSMFPAPKQRGHQMVLSDTVVRRGGKRSRRRTTRQWVRVGA